MEAPGFASADRDVKEYLIYRGMYKTLLSFIEENSALQNKSGGDSGNSLESQGRGDVFGMGTSGISASEESQFDGCFLKVKWHGPYGKYAPGVSAQMISNQLWSFIRKHKFSELNSLLRTIEESLISRLEKNLSTAFIGLRCSIEKLFIVYYLRSKLPVESILRQLLLVHESENIDKDPSLLYSSHWENAWFHIPLMENPTKHERLASYFKKEWEDGLIYSVFNFFEIVFSSLTPPRLLAIANEHSRLAALKSQVLSLRLELQEKSGYSLVDEEPDEFSECIFQRSEFFSNFSKSTEQRRRLRKLSSRNTFHSDSCTSAASFSLTGNFLAAFSHDYKLSIWNLESQNGFSTTYLHPETILFETSIHCLTWDHKAEQTLFVGCSNSKIKRWNTETCMLDLEFQLGGPTYIRDILIHPNESSILVTQSSCIENKSGDICSLDIWCLEYLQKKSSFETSYVSAPYQKLGLNQDFRILAAGASDGVVHIYGTFILYTFFSFHLFIFFFILQKCLRRKS